MEQNKDALRISDEARRTRVKYTVIYVLLAIWALAVLFPFYFMLLSSFKSYTDYSSEAIPELITLAPTLENYFIAFTTVPLLDYFINTLIFTVITTAVTLAVSIPAAFAFARLDFKGKNLVFTLLLALMMIPTELVIITNYVTVTELDLRNSFAGLVLPSVSSIFFIYLLRESFASIPNELYYAAKVDGTSDFKYMLRVVVPMCAPTVLTVGILKAIECWNSYVWPRLITDDEAYYLVSNGIQALRESGFGREHIPAMMAAVVVISLPLILLFLVFRRQIMSGVARGGIKG